MTKELTPGTAWPGTFTCPTTGDAVAQAAWEAPSQDLADGIGHVKDLVAGAGAGVTRVRTVSDTAALQALTGMNENDVALCGHLGVFVFKAIDQGWGSPWIYAANDASGFWEIAGGQFLKLTSGSPAGIAAVAIGGQLAVPDIVPNRIVKEQIATTTGVGIITTVDSTGGFGTYADTGVTITLTGLSTGDVVHFDASFYVEQNSATGKYRMISQEGNGAKNEVDGTERTVASANAVPVALVGRYVMLTDADLTLTLQGVATAGDYDVMSSSALRAVVIRP